jgi:hypothetical protein
MVLKFSGPWNIFKILGNYIKEVKGRALLKLYVTN